MTQLNRINLAWFLKPTTINRSEMFIRVPYSCYGDSDQLPACIVELALWATEVHAPSCGACRLTHVDVAGPESTDEAKRDGSQCSLPTFWFWMANLANLIAIKHAFALRQHQPHLTKKTPTTLEIRSQWLGSTARRVSGLLGMYPNKETLVGETICHWKK